MAKDKDRPKRKKQLLVLEETPILKPISIEEIGTNGDPCFGKEYDLTTSECKNCGDSELCAIIFAQNLNTTRAELEKENHYKDLDILIDIKGVKKYMRTLKRDGESKKTILEKAMSKFEIARTDARSIYKTIKDK